MDDVADLVAEHSCRHASAGTGDGGGGEGEGVRACVTSELGLILEPVQEGAGDEDVAARQRLPRKVLQFRRGRQALQLRERRHVARDWCEGSGREG